MKPGSVEELRFTAFSPDHAQTACNTDVTYCVAIIFFASILRLFLPQIPLLNVFLISTASMVDMVRQASF